MSAGHPHVRRLNSKHPAELDRLTREPSFQKMWSRPYTVIDTKQIPDTAGYSVDGSHYYRDRVFVEAVNMGHITVPNMKPEEILDAVLIHERVEKCMMDADNPIDFYLDAHEYATLAEHEYVKALGATPRAYEVALDPVIQFNESKELTDVPLDLACSPYLDEPDANDKRSLKEMTALGVVDAPKKSKEDKAVEYSKAKKGGDHCLKCASWEGSADSELAPCRRVCGAVRWNWWCKLFEKGKADGEGNGIQGGGVVDQQEGGGVEGPSGSDPGGIDTEGLPPGEAS